MDLYETKEKVLKIVAHVETEIITCPGVKWACISESLCCASEHVKQLWGYQNLIFYFRNNYTYEAVIAQIGVLGFDSRRGTGNFSLHHRVQNGSEAHPASRPVGTRGFFLGVKRPGLEADQSFPSTAEVKE
jgi:hypothetical protein